MSDIVVIILFFIGVFGLKTYFVVRMLNEAQSRSPDDDN
jgi:hypothetical protein